MNLIAAADLNWGIGKDGGPLDTSVREISNILSKKQAARSLSWGSATLESLPGGRPLPERTNIVLTSDTSFGKEGCIIVHSMEELMTECAKYAPDDVMIIGGEQVYMQLIRQCDRLFITKIFESI